MTGFQYSLYVHIPFCRHRCGYCDFNTYAGLETLAPRYVQAVCREIALTAEAAGERLPAHTVFFGGGTPSLLSIPQIEQILAAIQTAFNLQPGVEITLEANPGTLDTEYLRSLRTLGVNRLSLGMQSAQPGELRLLEREHDTQDVVNAVTWARKAGFNDLNLDLIFGLPEQPVSAWQNTLELALGLQPEHFSLYALTLEHGTPLRHSADRGLIPLPDPDLAAEMYEWAGERLEQAGFCQYEISNWARHKADGSLYACQHNLQYWRGLPYFGFGAGAHGYVYRQPEQPEAGYGGVRTANVLSPQAYTTRCLEAAAPLSFPRTPATATAEAVDEQSEIGETMMMGLRLVEEGIGRDTFQKRFGKDLEALFGPQIERLLRLGLLEWKTAQDGSESRLRLTRVARLLGNQVFVEFI
jgi:oxygen-independent coproporphyrinogen III oxidase